MGTEKTPTDPAVEKRAAARAALDYIEPGMRLGLGSGSTAEVLVKMLGERVKDGLTIEAAVPTSTNTDHLARSLGIPIVTLEAAGVLDLCLDGADEVDPRLNLIKGGGGALLREKIVATASQRRIIVVDSSKRVDVLGAFRLPIEVIPFAAAVVRRAVEQLGGTSTLRMRGELPFVTDENNHIFDCDFGEIHDPPRLADQLIRIPGVVEHGLFCGMSEVVLVGRGDDVETLRAD